MFHLTLLQFKRPSLPSPIQHLAGAILFVRTLRNPPFTLFLDGFSPDVLSQLASAQVSQLSQLGLPPFYPLLPQLLSAYQNPANLAGLSHGNLSFLSLPDGKL